MPLAAERFPEFSRRLADRGGVPSKPARRIAASQKLLRAILILA
jgi:hypothetical protein